MDAPTLSSKNAASTGATTANATDANTADAAREMAGHIGASSTHVLDATKEAGKQIGAVAQGEMSTLRTELDSLISRISSMSEVELAAAKDSLLATIESTQVATKGIAADVTHHLNHGVGVTTDYVKERPLQSVAVAAGIGILLGMLISRR